MKIIKPMLLSTYDKPFSSADFLFEPKFDGLRLLVGANFSYTRHGTITTTRFKELHFEIGYEVLLDGELIAPGTNTPDDFGKAMSRFSGNQEQPIQFIAFDILSYKNKSLTALPLKERKGILTEVIARIDSPYTILCPYMPTEGDALFQVIKDNHMEGCVAKSINSKYMLNKRSKQWLKIINWRIHNDLIVSKITFRPLTTTVAKRDFVIIKYPTTRTNTTRPPISSLRGSFFFLLAIIIHLSFCKYIIANFSHLLSNGT